MNGSFIQYYWEKVITVLMFYYSIIKYHKFSSLKQRVYPFGFHRSRLSSNPRVSHYCGLMRELTKDSLPNSLRLFAALVSSQLQNWDPHFLEASDQGLLLAPIACISLTRGPLYRPSHKMAAYFLQTRKREVFWRSSDRPCIQILACFYWKVHAYISKERYR